MFIMKTHQLVDTQTQCTNNNIQYWWWLWNKRTTNKKVQGIQNQMFRSIDVSNNWTINDEKYKNSNELKIMQKFYKWPVMVNLCDWQWHYIISKRIFLQNLAHMLPIPLHSQTPSPIRSKLSVQKTKKNCNTHH